MKRRKSRRISIGAAKIIQYLKDQKITHKKKYRIKECRDILPLPFDFAIFVNNALLCLIEYNGQQHYMPIRRFRGRKGLIKQQKHDQIKLEFCSKNNIPLLVIPYTDEPNIEEIIQNFLAYIRIK